MTTPNTIEDLVRRIAILESKQERRIGVVKEGGRDLKKMLFEVTLIDAETPTEGVGAVDLTGVRLLYMRQSPQLTAWMVPGEGETVVMERLGKGWVIVGSYAHNITARTQIKAPYGADWENRHSIPFEAQTNSGGIQLSSIQQSPLSGVKIGSDAILYLGKTRGGPDEDATDILSAIISSRHFTKLDGYNVEINPDGIKFLQLDIASPNGDPKLFEEPLEGTVLITGDADEPDALESDTVSGERTGSGGNPSHSHTIPAHSHFLPIFATKTLTVIEEGK